LTRGDSNVAAFLANRARALVAKETRTRHTAKIVSEFEAVQKNLGRYSLKTTKAMVLCWRPSSRAPVPDR
jgi:hypothetical protein